MQPAGSVTSPSPPADPAAPPPPSNQGMFGQDASQLPITDYYPHLFTLAALIYLLGPSPSCITLILSVTAVITCVVLRSGIPAADTSSHSAAVIAAAMSDMRTTQEVRAFYYGFLKGHEDGRRSNKGAGGGERKEDDDIDDARSDRTIRTSLGTRAARGICGPATMSWRDRTAAALSGAA